MNFYVFTSRVAILAVIYSLVFPGTAFSLTPAQSQYCSVDIKIPANQWRQFSLPCSPEFGDTIAEILADDIPGNYAQDWIVFAYDSSSKQYINPGINGKLKQGIGYWLMHTGAEEISLNFEGETIIPADTTRCPTAAPGGCVEIPLATSSGTSWQMLGHPLISYLEWDQARIITDSGTCANPDGCSITEAKNENIFHDEIWHYQGSDYQTIDDKGAINIANGYWSATLSNADNPRLLLPIPYDPSYIPIDVGIAAFNTVNSQQWDEAAVRRVLHTFAYGGHATEAQIQAWGNLSPQVAITQMLTLQPFNPLLSPPVATDSADLSQKGGTLRALGAFWMSDDPENDVDESNRVIYDTSPNTAFVYNDRLFERAVLSRGTNPFRQKIGLWESNYHLATNLQTDVTDWQMLRYYDDILESLADPSKNYADTLTKAALSAAVAEQYGHDKNKYINGDCQCNEDFAREYHQLFFGILGVDNPEHHETVSIKNTARAFTDMTVPWLPDIGERADYLNFGSAQHWPGNLAILGESIGGSRADIRIPVLSDIAIEHPESLSNLPELIIRGLGDDNLGAAELTEIRNVWNSMGDKNLLPFLRGYAISAQFHRETRLKYVNSFDRNLTVFNQTINNNNDINVYNNDVRIYQNENVKLFQPSHNVFGGQTGVEASTSSDIFRINYNRASSGQWRIAKYNRADWLKDWASTIPPGLTENYTVDAVGELLWKRYIGDGLKNYGVLERTYVNALLATNRDWADLVDANDLERVFSTAELTSNISLINLRQNHADTRIALDDSNANARRTANYRVGKAINFISATPYVFARGGN